MKRVLNATLMASAFMLSVTGCAATHTAIQITKANQAVTRAKDRGADEYAVYEYTMAEHYLTKAREEAGASDFKDSVTLAHGAAEWADKAIIIIEKEGRGLDETALPGQTQVLTDEDRAVSKEPESSEPSPDSINPMPANKNENGDRPVPIDNTSDTTSLQTGETEEIENTDEIDKPKEIDKTEETLNTDEAAE